MDDDRIVRLLEEIRDLQQQHMENSQRALKNQEESIALNWAWRKKYRSVRWGLAFLLVAEVVILALWLAAGAHR